MHGHGKFTFTDGNIHVGMFKDNERNGHGKTIFKNGSIYKGKFVNGRRRGHGKEITINGRIYEFYEGMQMNISIADQWKLQNVKIYLAYLIVGVVVFLCSRWYIY